MYVKQLYHLVRESINSWLDDYASSMGAAIAFYTLFSIAPMVLILISVVGLVFGAETARGETFGHLEELMGVEGARAVQGLLHTISQPRQGITGAAIGVALSLVGATTVLSELQRALDRIFRAPESASGGPIWPILRQRLLAFALILGLGVLLMLSLVMSAVLAAIGRWWSDWFGGWQFLARWLNDGLGFLLITILFAMVFKFLPRVRLAWREVWVGALVTALLFAIGKYVLGVYLARAGFSSGYGAAGSLVVMLIWVYYSSQIFLFGAEFTLVYARRLGSLKKEGEPAFA